MSSTGPESPDKPNSAKGRDSFDITVGGGLVNFFNKNVTPYPTDVSAPKFDLIPVAKQKDIMVNVARLHAQQEYDRIMELVTVLQKQAAQIKRRLEITDAVHSAYYQFQIYHGNVYWISYDYKLQGTRLLPTGPDDWSTGKPDHLEYLARVKWLGDHTWIEVDENGNPVN